MDGVYLIDKPVGITSHDAVAAVRRALGGSKTGHAGTLDPFASGLLLILVGRATRIQRHLMALPKRYETIARLGATSTTGDPEGEITLTGRIPPDPPPLSTGEIRQRPPIHSAVKIGGERAYRRARRGESFQMPERIVTIHRFEQLWRAAAPPEQQRQDAAPPEQLRRDAAPPEQQRQDEAPPEQQRQDEAPPVNGAPHPSPADPAPEAHAAFPDVRAAFLIECSSGTYVRSLIADLHDAYCVELRRTAIGPFTVNDAVPPPRRGEDWQAPAALTIEQAMAALP